MRFNQKIIIVFLLLSVFAVGTLQFVDTVEAAAWTKYNSGKFTNEYPAAGEKKIMTYQSYIKGTNQLYVNIYSYSKKTNKKKLDTRLTFNKKNGIMKTKMIDYSWNYTSPEQFKTSQSVKTAYKTSMNELIKGLSVPLKSKAFNMKTFKVKKNTFKTYSVKNDDSFFSGFIYKNNEEYITFSLYKENNTITYAKFNQKRVLTSEKNFNSTQTLSTIYKNELDKIVNKIKLS
ncbi:MAG: hypothetical protein LBU74_06915 [Methanobacteriaceae archaeon]|nr:hypothetical protein [Candidatus Methanorudis spinitermitis]